MLCIEVHFRRGLRLPRILRGKRHTSVLGSGSVFCPSLCFDPVLGATRLSGIPQILRRSWRRRQWADGAGTSSPCPWCKLPSGRSGTVGCGCGRNCRQLYTYLEDAFDKPPFSHLETEIFHGCRPYLFCSETENDHAISLRRACRLLCGLRSHWSFWTCPCSFLSFRCPCPSLFHQLR